jgi:hypothetical protein
MAARRKFLIGAIALLAVGLAVIGYQNLWAQPRAPLNSQYQAVLLSNGQVFYGKLEQVGSPYPVLTDVYWIRSHVDPQTKQVSNSLVRRGGEWHAPDRMVLNAQHILVIEPVRPDSTVAKLIADSKRK